MNLMKLCLVLLVFLIPLFRGASRTDLFVNFLKTDSKDDGTTENPLKSIDSVIAKLKDQTDFVKLWINDGSVFNVTKSWVVPTAITTLTLTGAGIRASLYIHSDGEIILTNTILSLDNLDIKVGGLFSNKTFIKSNAEIKFGVNL